MKTTKTIGMLLAVMLVIAISLGYLYLVGSLLALIVWHVWQMMAVANGLHSIDFFALRWPMIGLVFVAELIRLDAFRDKGDK